MCEAILFIFLIEGLVFPTHLPSPSKLTHQSKMFPSFILNNRITPFIFSISLMKLIRNTEQSRLRSKPNRNLETRERLNSLVTKLHMKILVELADVIAPPSPHPPGSEQDDDVCGESLGGGGQVAQSVCIGVVFVVRSLSHQWKCSVRGEVTSMEMSSLAGLLPYIVSSN